MSIPETEPYPPGEASTEGNVFNMWLVLRNDTQAELRGWVQEYRVGAYDGPYPELIQFISETSEAEGISRLFKRLTVGQWTYKLWSLSSGKPSKWQKIQDQLDAYDATLPTNALAVAGVWRHNGTQVGTDPVTGEGTPMYPINTTDLLRFMPPTITVTNWPDMPNPDTRPEVIETEETPATDLTDINATLGGNPRDFVTGAT